MPPKGHRRSAAERVAKEVAAATQKKAPASKLNPLVAVLMDWTDERAKRVRKSVEAGTLSREHVRAAIVHDLGEVAKMMRDRELTSDMRMGFGLRRDLLEQLLKSLEEGAGSGGMVTVEVQWAPRFYGPQHGDQLRTGKGMA